MNKARWGTSWFLESRGPWRSGCQQQWCTSVCCNRIWTLPAQRRGSDTLKGAEKLGETWGISQQGQNLAEAITSCRLYHITHYCNLEAEAQVVGVCPVTGGLRVWTSTVSIVSLSKTLFLLCPLMVVRGPTGANYMAAMVPSVCPRAAVATIYCSLPPSVKATCFYKLHSTSYSTS